MRKLKPLLPLDGVPAVLRVAGAYRAVGLEALVVLGFGAARVAPLLDAHGVRCPRTPVPSSCIPWTARSSAARR